MRRWVGTAVVWALVVLTLIVSVQTLQLAPAMVESRHEDASVLEHVLITVATVGLASVGALIVHRRPGNRIGWMLLVAGCSLQLVIWAELYALHAHAVSPEPTAGAVWLAWLATWTFVVPIALLWVFLPLLFPDGRLPSRRWRPFLWVVAFYLLIGSIGSYMLHPGPMRVGGTHLWDNPLGIDALAGFGDAIRAMEIMTFLPALVGIVAAVAVRWRRSRGVERQQMKWYVAGVTVLASYTVLVIAFPAIGVAIGLAMLALPAAVGIAVLRYRLYDIDRIVSRTVSYVLLSALLAGVYVAGVVGLGGLVRSLTGGGGGDLVVAASTLAVAALFVPARRRIQGLVDRRFNRARYDAQQTVEVFGQRLRDEVDLVTVRQMLAVTAGSVMEPRTVGVWLRGDREVLR